jgi:hypothetical protein
LETVITQFKRFKNAYLSCWPSAVKKTTVSTTLYTTSISSPYKKRARESQTTDDYLENKKIIASEEDSDAQPKSKRRKIQTKEGDNLTINEEDREPNHHDDNKTKLAFDYSLIQCYEDSLKEIPFDLLVHSLEYKTPNNSEKKETYCKIDKKLHLLSEAYFKKLFLFAHPDFPIDEIVGIFPLSRIAVPDRKGIYDYWHKFDFATQEGERLRAKIDELATESSYKKSRLFARVVDVETGFNVKIVGYMPKLKGMVTKDILATKKRNPNYHRYCGGYANRLFVKNKIYMPNLSLQERDVAQITLVEAPIHRPGDIYGLYPLDFENLTTQGVRTLLYDLPKIYMVVEECTLLEDPILFLFTSKPRQTTMMYLPKPLEYFLEEERESSEGVENSSQIPKQIKIVTRASEAFPDIKLSLPLNIEEFYSTLRAYRKRSLFPDNVQISLPGDRDFANHLSSKKNAIAFSTFELRTSDIAIWSLQCSDFDDVPPRHCFSLQSYLGTDPLNLSFLCSHCSAWIQPFSLFWDELLQGVLQDLGRRGYDKLSFAYSCYRSGKSILKISCVD